MILDILIVFFSCTASYLFSSKFYYRYGFFVAMCGQPLWLYETYSSKKWGMFIVSIWFTIQHIRGIYNHWIKK